MLDEKALPMTRLGRTVVVSAVADADDRAQGTAGPTALCVDPLGDPFLRTRIALPSRSATYLRRQRLVRHLDQALQTPLTLLNGAAGAGKTLLAADWAAGLRQPVAWLTAEEGDGRPGVFWAYLVQALRACGVPACGAIGLPSEAARVDHKLLATLAAELNERDQPVVVVLDEYDRVTAPRRRSSWNSSCTTPAPACAWSSSAGRNPCCRCIATGQPAS